MTSFGKLLAKVLLGVSMAGVVGCVPGARGQSQKSSAMAAKPDTPDPADQGWHVDVAPYIWFAGVNGTVGTAGRQSSIHVSAGDVLSNVNFGIMGAVDARYNRIVIPVDFMWVKLTDERGLPIGQGTTSLHVKLNEDIFTPKVGYRLVSKERFKVDALVGIRFWHVGNTLTLQPQPANGRYGATNWVDGVEGAIPVDADTKGGACDWGRCGRRWCAAGLSGSGAAGLQGEKSDVYGWMAIPGDSQKSYRQNFRRSCSNRSSHWRRHSAEVAANNSDLQELIRRIDR
jgi:hypothetical protein